MTPPDAAAAASARSAVSLCHRRFAAEMGGAVRCPGAKKREFRLKMRKKDIDKFRQICIMEVGRVQPPVWQLAGDRDPPRM